jgi:hypothetical protein
MSRRIKCPVTKKDIINQCKDCEYNGDCLEDVLNDFELNAMKLAGEAISEIRRIIVKREKSSS